MPEAIQEAVDRQHLSVKVALALGQAPPKFQPELARLAAQNDFTEKQALWVAGYIREEVLRVGQAAVDVGQAAVALGLLPPAVSAESRSAGPALANTGAAGVSAPASDSAAATTTGTTPSPPPAVSAQHRKHGRGRVPERAVSFEGAMNVLKAYFPPMDLHDARSLAELAVKLGLNKKVLLLAGLYRLEGEQALAEAVKSALNMPLTPEVRAQLATLEAIVRQYDLIERGRFDDKSERLLQLQLLVARQPGRVRQAAAQVRKKTVA